MNKKQIIVMWIGIAVFVCLGYFGIARSDWEALGDSLSGRPRDYGPLIVRLSSTVLVTAGLIYTLRDKKSKGD
jgi:hypothetical protein